MIKYKSFNGNLFMQIILASSSPYRKQLLKSLNISFEVIPSNVNESYIKKSAKNPDDLVKKLALKKVKVVEKILKRKEITDYIIIGADSIAALQTKKGWVFLDKPKNKWQARKMALMFRGKMHRFYTGLVVLRSDGKQKTSVTSSKIYFKNFSAKILHKFIESEIWKGRAGGYDVYENKTDLIDKIEGNLSNFLGLPIQKLTSALKEFGVTIETRKNPSTSRYGAGTE